MIDAITKQIADIDSKMIAQMSTSTRNEDIRIALLISGMGFVLHLLSWQKLEILEISVFMIRFRPIAGSCNQFINRQASLWTAIFPNMVSPHIRSMIIEVAHVIIRTRQDSKLKKNFFTELKREDRCGFAGQKGSVHALSFANPLRILQGWFDRKDKEYQAPYYAFGTSMILEEMIAIIIKAEYEVRKMNTLKAVKESTFYLEYFMAISALHIIESKDF